MKVFSWEYSVESFLDRKEGNIFFDVEVGLGRPQRLYPETQEEFQEMWEKRVRYPLNPEIGRLWPSRQARERGELGEVERPSGP